MILSERWRRWLFPVWAATAALVLVGTQVWLRLDPGSLRPQLAEHTVIETATALFAVAGCVVAAIQALRSEHRWAWVALSGLCLFTAGEEVTWGQGLLWEGHTHVLGLYVDNAHDFFDVFLEAAAIYVVDSEVTIWFLLLVALTVGGLTLALQVGLGLSRRDVQLLGGWPWRFVVLAVLAGFLSQWVDNRVFDPLALSELERRSLEEPLELVSALALCLAALSRGPVRQGTVARSDKP